MSFKRTAITALLAGMLMLGACNGQPDHARYIPKDALMVTGLNTRALSRKVAWNIIKGSKLFKQMQQQMPDKSKIDLDQSGIDVLNTFYVYAKGNSGMAGSTLVGLVPLNDAAKWEVFVKNVFPAASVRTVGTRRMAFFGNGLFAGWSNGLMIIMNVLDPQRGYIPDVAMDSNSARANDAITDSSMAVKMEDAFSVTKENSLTGNARFTKLLHEGHDLSLWVNYDQLMTQYMTQGMSKMMGGMTLSNVLWKDAELAGGMDFEKGKITGDVHYYVSDDMRDAAKELGGTNADKDMVDRLPKKSLDMVMAYHLAPKGLKAMLDKTGMLGLANLALATQGVNADYVLDAFTGDMAIAVNDLDVKKRPETADVQNVGVAFNGYTPQLNAIYVLKINKKENFRKLLDMSAGGNMMKLNDNTYAMPTATNDSIIIMTNDNYAVVTNKSVNATRYLQGLNKDQKDDATSKIYGHPFSMYMDVQEMLHWLDPGMLGDALNEKKVAAAKGLLENVWVTGGAFSNNAFEYHMDVNFKNKDENSLLTLMDLGMTMQVADSTQASK